MSIHADGVKAVAVGSLLDERDFPLRIPHYQRPYSWEPRHALQLVEDVLGALLDGIRSQVPYVLGAVILHRRPESGDLDVVDGQQRLLTLRMLLAALDAEVLALDGDSPVARVWSALRTRLRTLTDVERADLAEFVRRRCQVVVVVTDDVDEAFRVFDSQNYRGMPLRPHDLLKAHHLRAMEGESQASKAAAVEGWESVRDGDLDRLFSVFLYRIVKWSRGESAQGFTVHDIGLFKGIAPGSATTPAQRYHLAAQLMGPAAAALVSPDARADRSVQHARFQLDAPVVAGSGFFAMVAFMLKEVDRLAVTGFDQGREIFSPYVAKPDEAGGIKEKPSRGRYLYVGEMYLASLLVYVNRFGEEEAELAKERLFAWAYRLRTELSRVQFRSLDNRARLASSAFVCMRNSYDAGVIRCLQTAPGGTNHESEPKLRALMLGEESR